MKIPHSPVGQILRELREQNGLGIKTVGKRLNISYSYLSKIENDHKTPSGDLIEKLSLLYGADQDELLARINRLPTDIQDILSTHGKDVFELIRGTYGNNDRRK